MLTCLALTAGLCVASGQSPSPRAAGNAETNRLKNIPGELPPEPSSRAPVNYFRELLALSVGERDRALLNRTPQQKATILSKLKEYEAMSPDQRELKLRVSQLRWYLLPLMRMEPGLRQAQLKTIPAEDRSLVASRLEHWDKLTPELQKEFLQNEKRISQFLKIEASSPAERAAIMESFPAHKRQQLERDLTLWKALPFEQRQRMCDSFNDYFELKPEEQDKVLGTLSEAEREQMQKTLESFDKLPIHQRRQCIVSFRKFANFSVAERNQFLRNAEVWQTMAPAERQLWRELVHTIPRTPPLPPSLHNFPPMPNKLATTNSVR